MTPTSLCRPEGARLPVGRTVLGGRVKKLPLARRLRRIVVLCTVAAVMAQVFAAASVTAQAPTKAEIFRAFDARGHSLLRTRVRSGLCKQGSVAIKRRDAWRCGAGRRVRDPCFSSPRRPGLVLCPDAAWKHTGLRLKLTSPLPRKGGNRLHPSLGAQPWALELFDGRRCLIQTGATRVTGDLRANYACGTTEDWLWGSPDRATEPWMIFSAPYAATTLTIRVPIRRAWM
jgi:hypothetical protein